MISKWSLWSESQFLRKWLKWLKMCKMIQMVIPQAGHKMIPAVRIAILSKMTQNDSKWIKWLEMTISEKPCRPKCPFWKSRTGRGRSRSLPGHAEAKWLKFVKLLKCELNSLTDRPTDRPTFFLRSASSFSFFSLRIRLYYCIQRWELHVGGK